MTEVTLRLILSGYGTSKHSGSALTMAFQVDQSVAEAKQQIITQWPHEFCDVAIEKKKLNLLMAGQLLDDLQPLSHYNLQCLDYNVTLHLMLQPLEIEDGAREPGRQAEQVDSNSKCCTMM